MILSGILFFITVTAIFGLIGVNSFLVFPLAIILFPFIILWHGYNIEYWKVKNRIKDNPIKYLTSPDLMERKVAKKLSNVKGI